MIESSDTPILVGQCHRELSMEDGVRAHTQERNEHEGMPMQYAFLSHSSEACELE